VLATPSTTWCTSARRIVCHCSLRHPPFSLPVLAPASTTIGTIYARPWLTAKEAELSAKGYAAWNKARTANDWDSFAPVLQELVDLRKARPDRLLVM